MTSPPTPRAGSHLVQTGPALLGAASFACADVLAKVVLNDGADVLTLSAIRGALSIAILYGWLRLNPRPDFPPRARWISLGLGRPVRRQRLSPVHRRFATVEVPIAILTYFVYPLLTGLGGGGDRAGEDHAGGARSRRSPRFSASR